MSFKEKSDTDNSTLPPAGGDTQSPSSGGRGQGEGEVSMSEQAMAKVQQFAEQIQEARKGEDIDYARMTAPCGIPCFECYMYLANGHDEMKELISQVTGIPVEMARCRGCRDENGAPEHLPMECRSYSCAQQKGVDFCCDCGDFPCDFLHPYLDRATLWHNTKVFSLCQIKKMGLENWARNKARSTRDTYFFGKWTL